MRLLPKMVKPFGLTGSKPHKRLGIMAKSTKYLIDMLKFF